MLWKVYLDELPNRFNATHEFLANIAFEIYKGRLKDPSKAKIEQFQLKFEVVKPKVQEELTEEAVKARTTVSKNFWKALAGGKSKPVPQKPKPQKPKPRTRR